MGAIHTINALEGKTMKANKMEYLEIAEQHRQKAESAASEYLRNFHLEQVKFWTRMANA